MTTPDKTHHFWVMEGNFKAAADVDGTPARAYPLAILCPPTALTTASQGIVLEAHTRTLTCSCELVAVIGKALHNSTERLAAEAIRGYRLMVGLRDSHHLDRLTNPTDRDRGVCAYYARWGDGLNCLSDALLAPGAAAAAYEQATRLDIDGISPIEANTAELVLRAPAAIAYLSQITTLQPGDLLALGPTHPLLTIPADRQLADGTKVHAALGQLLTLETTITDRRASAH